MTEMLTDAERFPLMTEQGRAFLTALREHPFAPVYAAASGNRLTAERLARVRAFEAELNGTAGAWAPGRAPAGLGAVCGGWHPRVPVVPPLRGRPRGGLERPHHTAGAGGRR